MIRKFLHDAGEMLSNSRVLEDRAERLMFIHVLAALQRLEKYELVFGKFLENGRISDDFAGGNPLYYGFGPHVSVVFISGPATAWDVEDRRTVFLHLSDPADSPGTRDASYREFELFVREAVNRGQRVGVIPKWSGRIGPLELMPDAIRETFVWLESTDDRQGWMRLDPVIRATDRFPAECIER